MGSTPTGSTDAEVVELGDTLGLGPSARKGVQVRPLSSVL